VCSRFLSFSLIILVYCVRVVVLVEHVLSHCCNMCYFDYCSGSASFLTLVSSCGGCCFSSSYDFSLFSIVFAVSVVVLSGYLASWSCYA
jgi:hypothetical protein